MTYRRKPLLLQTLGFWDSNLRALSNIQCIVDLDARIASRAFNPVCYDLPDVARHASS